MFSWILALHSQGEGSSFHCMKRRETIVAFWLLCYEAQLRLVGFIQLLVKVLGIPPERVDASQGLWELWGRGGHMV